MVRRRVLISGMGGELGARVASVLESQEWAGDILGVDVDPPRRRLRRADFRLADPTDGVRIAGIVERFAPDVVLHLAVYEPEARASAGEAARWTPAFAEAVLEGAGSAGTVRHLVVRSGIEVYGAKAGDPDVHTLPAPTSPFGRQLIGIESAARRFGDHAGISVTTLRLAPVLGAHVPSPLGRVLRQPLVPCPLLRDPRLTVIGEHDAAAVISAAAGRHVDAVINAVGAGTISLRQAIRAGGRVPAPLIGPQWRIARPTSHLLGAPIPDHVHELLTSGRTAIGSDLEGLLAVRLQDDTRTVIQALHSWEQVTRFVPSRPSEALG